MRPRHRHYVHKPRYVLRVAVIMVAPVLVDAADPVLESTGYWFKMAILCFWYVNDDISIKQRGRNRAFLDKQTVRNGSDPSWRVVAPEIDKFGPLAVGNSSHPG